MSISETDRLPAVPWDVYPRPQLRRDSYLSLNGTWLFDLLLPGTVVDDGTETAEKRVAGVPITVPFPPQSAPSGLQIELADNDVLFYRRSFSLPEGFRKDRVLLHFDAVDQTADVYLNGAYLGHHEGGYDRFSFDITEKLQVENDLIVRVTDHLDAHILPFGKQRHKRGGMWYTPISGIWQSVWLESVPASFIQGLRVRTKGADVTVDLRVSGPAASGGFNPSSEVHNTFPEVRDASGPSPEVSEISGPAVNIPHPLLTLNGSAYEGHPTSDGFRFSFTVPDARFWSPEEPFLYDFSVTFGEDRIDSYFGLRDLRIGEDENRRPRLFLNGRPYYFHGVLDQGYFPDGIFTPASPEAFEKDLRMLKDTGFNMLRKHIKVEPDLFYERCDRLGIAVFQDMVENGDYSFLRDTAFPSLFGKKKKDKKLHRDPAMRKAFLDSMKKTVKALDGHPSIVYWTIFNEGWGQFSSSECYETLKALDDTRFIDSASGWFQGGKTDVRSEHVYFKKVRAIRADKPFVLSEYGGYTFAVPGHVWNPKHAYGYKTFKDPAAYRCAVEKLFEEELLPLIPYGLSADVYTQLSDVEDEINGLVTYDRAVLKIDPENLNKIGEKMRSVLKP